ncbi:hypothetical protein TrVFT333_003300 [Trichoderma virens FT-333]|nr:hypothetical protein TrVFT333_003300 [Trichoderma virens FT-333]
MHPKVDRDSNSPPERIHEESDAYITKYQEFWKGREGTATEIETRNKAFQSAFERFHDIYHCLGWRDNEDLTLNCASLCKYQPALIESIFAIEAYRMKSHLHYQESARASFEYSRLPRLLLILIRIESRRNMRNRCRPKTDNTATSPDDNNQELKASEILAVLAQVARTMRQASWVDGSYKMTLQELLQDCYSRRLLQQPRSTDVEEHHEHMRLLTDCLMALDFTHRFREVPQPLSKTFYYRYSEEPIHKIMDMVLAYGQSQRAVNRFKQLSLQDSDSSTFIPDHFTIRHLRDFGNLKIEWTDCLDDHLKIYTGRNAIRIFAHPTFFYNCIDLHKNERDYLEPTFIELSQTYALLFRPSSRRNLNILRKFIRIEYSFRGRVTFGGNDIPIFSRRRNHGENDVPSEDIDLDIGQNPIKGMLDNFFRCSLPPSLQVAFNISQPTKMIEKIARWDQHMTTQAPMQQILGLAPYPEDIKFMATSLLAQEFGQFEAFQTFPYFGSRLRQLKTYLDAHQPRTWLQLWRDDRDVRVWWAFWIFIGSVSVIIPIAIIGIILQAIYLARYQ